MKIVTNDIEMIILAFGENKEQFYVPRDKRQVISQAIKMDTLYTHKVNSGNRYRWNPVTHSFQIE